MSLFVRAALYTAGYCALAALGCGSVSLDSLTRRSKRSGALGRWLLLCVFSVMGATVIGAAASLGSRGAATGGLILAVYILILPEKRITLLSDIPIPVSVFFASAGYGIKAASLTGALLGLALAALAEVWLNPHGGGRKRLKMLVFMSYTMIGLTELCVI